ncbi:MAG: hypothetical protein ACXQTI_02785 [Candidatus Nezhaarchaeales archaeon]
MGLLDKWTNNSPVGKAFKKSPLYDEAYGDTKKFEEEAKKAQKKQSKEIKRQRIIEDRRLAESESDVALRRERMGSRQYGRRSLLGG